MYKSDNKTRMAIAELAARFIAEDGLLSYHAAKQKAAEQLGNNRKKNLPTNNEIEQSLANYQNIFQSDSQTQSLNERRRLTLELMQLLNAYQPRLVGSVLSGTAGTHSEITVHLFSDDIEAIGFCLEEHNIPYKLSEKRIRASDNEIIPYPACSFLAGNIPITLIIFPEQELRHPPLCPIDGKPMKRADIHQVRALI